MNKMPSSKDTYAIRITWFHYFFRSISYCHSYHFRSDKAGKLLAEVLLKGLQGNRYNTLNPRVTVSLLSMECLD